MCATRSCRTCCYLTFPSFYLFPLIECIEKRFKGTATINNLKMNCGCEYEGWMQNAIIIKDRLWSAHHQTRNTNTLTPFDTTHTLTREDFQFNILFWFFQAWKNEIFFQTDDEWGRRETYKVYATGCYHNRIPIALSTWKSEIRNGTFLGL